MDQFKAGAYKQHFQYKSFLPGSHRFFPKSPLCSKRLFGIIPKIILFFSIQPSNNLAGCLRKQV